MGELVIIQIKLITQGYITNKHLILGLTFRSFGAKSHILFSIVPQSKPYPHKASFCQGLGEGRKELTWKHLFIYSLIQSLK